MSLHNISSTTDTFSHNEQPIPFSIQQLPRYAVCAATGIVGGGIGVMFTIGMAVIAQGVLFPTIIFLPNVILLTIVATLMGLSCSFLLAQLGRRIMPNLLEAPENRALQVVFVFSTLTTLMETFLFMQGF